MPKLHLQDIDLYYEMSGAGEPLLFIHGLGSSSRDWEYQVEHFSASHRVVVFDLRGHGASAKPAVPYTMPLFAADAAALLRTLNLAPAHVVGISLGGMIGLQLAASYPELVRSLTVVNTRPELVLRSTRDKLRFALRLFIVRLLGMRALGRVLGRQLFPGKGQEQLRRELARRWAGNDTAAYLASMRAIAGWSVADHIGGLEMPVLVVAAEYDYTPVSAKAAYAALMPRGELRVIPEAHHAVTVEYPEKFNAVLEEFLAGIEKPIKP